jgi:hypothetical protein
MATLDKMIGHLPSLYRPEAGHESILVDLLTQWGQELDSISDRMTDVMQAHWHGYADRAQYSPYFNRDREQRGLPIISPNTLILEERQLLDEFPYINDLARLGALLELPVWREPSELRENVEAYRIRLRKMFQMYRNGLGTLDAVRTIVEANLPLDMGVPRALRHRSFSVEEYAPLSLRGQDAIAKGAPLEYVGPLMRWELNNEGLDKVQPTVYIEGVAPQSGEFDATERPLIECMGSDGQASDGQASVGLAYNGTLAPGAVLKLVPIPTSYLSIDGELLHAAGTPGQQMATGDWQVVADLSGSDVRLLCQTVDHTLWAVLDNAGVSELWRHRGTDWQRVLAGFAFTNIHMLRAFENDLYIGDDNGLHIVSCLPETEGDYQLQSSELFSDPVYDMHFDGLEFWFATEIGVFTVPQGGISAVATPLQAATYCIATKDDHSLYFGGVLGVVHFHRGYDRWTHLIAESASDLDPDWLTFDSGSPAVSFLPPVIDLVVSSDATLWMATEQGLARYFCYRSGRTGLAYTTQLQSFPDIVQGSVARVEIDAAGLLWFCGASGLFRFDGRDFLQYQQTDDIWQSLGAVALVYPNDVDTEDRGRWRFNNGLASPVWEQFDSNSNTWEDPALALRSSASMLVHDFLWGHSIEAHLGAWNGDNFEPASQLPLSDFTVRVKRSATQIVNGGVVALPALQKGRSSWRYLALEATPLHEPAVTPWWSKEGRLVPESGDEATPYPGRFRNAPDEPDRPVLPAGRFEDVVFAYLPAARVTFTWAEKKPFSLLVRLAKRSAEEVIHPAVLDRVWQGMQKVKPAGAQVMLAIEHEIVRGIEQ